MEKGAFLLARNAPVLRDANQENGFRPRPVPRDLKLYAAHELHDARPEGRAHKEEVRAIDILVLTQEEIGFVEQVERFSTELKFQVLFEPDVLDD